MDYTPNFTDYGLVTTAWTEAFNQSAQQRVASPSANPEWLVKFRYVCEVGFAMPIALLGILGNLFAFVVLCRYKQRSTTCILLQGLAITDTLILICTILLRSFRYSIPGYVISVSYLYMFRWLYPSVYVLRLIGTWMTVLLTVDRFIAVCHPLHAQRLCTLRRTYFLIALMSVLTILISLPRYFEFKIVIMGKAVHSFTTPFQKDQAYTVAYRIVCYLLIMYLIPMILMIILNTLLLSTLRNASSHRHALQERYKFQNSVHKRSSKECVYPRNPCTDGLMNGTVHDEMNGTLKGRIGSNNVSVTIIVVTVVLVTITCNITAMVAHILWSLSTSFHLTHLETTRRILSNVSNVLVTLNSAINFVIYCFCSRNFRSVCSRTFKLGHYWCHCKTHDLHNPLSGSSATSYISLLRLSINARKKNSEQLSGHEDEVPKK